MDTGYAQIKRKVLIFTDRLIFLPLNDTFESLQKYNFVLQKSLHNFLLRLVPEDAKFDSNEKKGLTIDDLTISHEVLRVCF